MTIGKTTQELIGRYTSTRYLSSDGTFCIGSLANKQTVKGNPPRDGLVEGLDYRFIGRWVNDETYGRQFEFKTAVQHSPSTRIGVVEYLKKYAPYIGEVTAHRLCDAYGADGAIGTLKSDPRKVATEVSGITQERAVEASTKLKEIERFQETQVKLLELLTGSGIGDQSFEQCIDRWGAQAPEVIRRDPFKLMTARIKRAGFLTCDKLWHKFGLPPDRMKRQVMAAWEHLRSDSSGSTWFAKHDVIQTVKESITGRARPDRAVAIAIRGGLLIQEEHDGELWVADRKAGNEEITISEKLEMLT